MIWTCTDPTGLRAAFAPAGPLDRQVVADHLGRTGRRSRPATHQDLARHYYLWRDDPRVRLTVCGPPLDHWTEPAMLIVGTMTLLGEFAGTRHLAGQRGLNLKMLPAAWLTGPADQAFADAAALLEAIAPQILDAVALARYAPPRPAPDPNDWYITQQAAAELTGIPISTISTWVARKKVRVEVAGTSNPRRGRQRVHRGDILARAGRRTEEPA